MDTLYAIGMMIGLMKAHAEPPKVVPAFDQRQFAQRQVAQQQVAQHQVVQQPAATDKARPPAKKSEWLLSY